MRHCINKVNAMSGADVIDFTVTGTINLKGALPDLASDIDIQGPGSHLLTIRRDTGGDYRIFTLSAGVVAIRGLSVTNGKSDVGGGIYNQSSLTLDDVVVTFNKSSVQGGGLYNGGILTASNTVVHNNTCVGGSAGYGGGIYNADNGTMSIFSSSIINNVATGLDGYGGGAYNRGALAISDTTVSGNSARATVTGCDCDDVAMGGGIFNDRGSLDIKASAIFENYTKVPGGAGLFETGFVFGGGIYSSGPASIDNSTVAKNYVREEMGDAVTSGGGIYIQNPSTMTISHSTVAGNYASAVGYAPDAGGIGIGTGGILHLSNSIVANNQLMQEGQTNGNGPDIEGTLAASGFNLIGNSSGGSGFAPTDILNVDPLLGPLANNGGPTLTLALLPGSPAIDAGDNADAPEFDQRGPGFPRIVDGTIDIGAFEVQATGAPALPDILAFLITADADTEWRA